jgi:phage baseplate assembly protein W
MADNAERFGTDLRLLENLEFQSDRNRGSDLATIERDETREIDLETLAGVDNLKQALLLRFLTPMGELAALGHPDYGSRLYELIGERNIESNRNRAKLYVLQALAAEPRVKQVRSVRVTQSLADRTRVDIAVSLTAIVSDTPLNLVFPFFL